MQPIKNNLILAIFLTLFILTIFINMNVCNFENRNILKHMKDGLENTAIMAVYQDGFSDMANITDEPAIVNYIDIDLNNDGQIDKIVIIRSVVHTGSRGDTFEFLLNDKGSFK